MESISLWNYNPEKNADKTYDMAIAPNGEGFDVFALYGRRGSSQAMVIQATCVSKQVADRKFAAVLKTRFAHGYVVVTPGLIDATLAALEVASV